MSTASSQQRYSLLSFLPSSRFSRNEEGRPKEIFIKNLSSTPNLHGHDQIELGSNRLRSNNASQEDRFTALIEAYQFHYQADADLADGRLVQSRLESMDPTIYTREQCSTFKHLLKLVRLSGIDINWEQAEADVTSIRIRLADHGPA